jgi:hypothetical protein
VIDIDPFGRADRDLMWRVAACWIRERPRSGSGSRLLDAAIEAFTPIDETTLLQEAKRTSLPIDLGPKLGWIIGMSLDKAYPATVPITTIQLDGDDDTVTRCCVRTGIFQEREDGTVGAHGWRFELGEPEDGALHPYQHAQPIVGWTTSGSCLIHPPDLCQAGCAGIDQSDEEGVDDERIAARDRVNQSHPAFPFPTQTLTGLLAVTIASFYGAPSVRALIETDPRLSRASGAVANDLGKLFG